MVEHNQSRISIDEAVRRTAEATAVSDGDEWLGPPTARQFRLIARYIDGASKPQPYSIMPSNMSFVVGGQRWAKYPADPALLAEVERALYQRDLYEEQREVALDRLVSHDFDIDAQDIDGDALERELRKPGGVVTDSVAPVGDKPARNTIAAETKCKAWLTGKMRASPKVRPKSKINFRTEAQKQFRWLRGRAFERAWRAAIRETGADWSRPGPTPESPH